MRFRMQPLSGLVLINPASLLIRDRHEVRVRLLWPRKKSPKEHFVVPIPDARRFSVEHLVHHPVRAIGAQSTVAVEPRDAEHARPVPNLLPNQNAGGVVVRRIQAAEASWILEDNIMMCRVLEAIGGKPYKTYRIYEKTLPTD